MSWLIYSTVGIARTYLKEDQSRRMYQRKSGTDNCEHEFSGSRLRNPKPTQGDMRKITARRTGMRSSSAYTNLNKSNASGDKSIYVDELIKPIPKKHNLKWIIELYTNVKLSKDIITPILLIIFYKTYIMLPILSSVYN